jgi:hypothetical protein
MLDADSLVIAFGCGFFFGAIAAGIAIEALMKRKEPDSTEDEEGEE